MIDLSIIIPIYNGEKYIDSCLEQIIKNKSDNFEVILLNDGSSDNTNNICIKYEKRDKRIKYIKKENSGVSDTRNLGISLSKGKWLMFVDCDDKLDEFWYECVSKHFSDKEDIIFFSKQNEISIITKCEILDRIFNFTPNTFFSSPCSRLYKSKLLKFKKIYFIKNIINGEDMLFNAECILASKKYKIVSNGFYNYRKVLGSATNKFNKEIFESDKKFIDRIRDLQKKYNYDLQKYIIFSSINKLYTFATRLSFIKYNDAKKYKKYLVMTDEEYKNIDMIKSKYKKIILKLLKHKMYFLAIKSIKIKNTLNMLRKRINKNNDSNFIKI